MKKFYYLLASIAMVLVIVVACESSSETEELQALQEMEISAKGDKVSICHYDTELDEHFLIDISVNALDKHMANHEDKYPFSPEGTYYFYYTTNGGTTLYGLSMFDIDPLDGINISGTGQNLNNGSDIFLKGEMTSLTEFEGTYSYLEDFSARNYSFNGTVDECGGIIEISGQFWGPVPSDSPVLIGGPNPF